MFKPILSALLISLAAAPVHAEDFVIPAGKWEMTVTHTNPMMPTPVTRTTTECRETTTFTPEELLQDSQDCEVTQQDVSGSVLTFQVHCAAQGGEINGSGRYEIDGDDAKGHMEMTMQAQGQTMKMNMEMVGKRLGDC